MAKVTSKYQVTLPRAIARAYGIEPGAEIVFELAGEVIQVRRAEADQAAGGGRGAPLEWFDEATRRQAVRDAAVRKRLAGLRGVGRGWRREDLYTENEDERG